MTELLKKVGQFETGEVSNRDGAQDPRGQMLLEKKLAIIQLLDGFGFDYIEAGWPGANSGDTKLFRQAKDSLVLKHARLVAFGMTAKDGRPEEDTGLKRLLDAGTDVITIVGKTWKQNIERVLPLPPERNLDNIYESVKYLRSQGREVFFDAEHWFDSYKQNPGYALRALEAASAGGASRLVLCDTRGASTDKLVFDATSAAVKKYPDAKIGIHIHQDSELAVVNTIRALEAGAVHVQGTVNGVGERAGNLNWCSFLPTAQFKYGIESGLDLTKLTPFAHAVARIHGIPVPLNAPYVGHYAFAHKGGLHASGQERDIEAYEHIRPEWVGNKRIYVFSEQGGSAHLEYMLKTRGYKLNRKDPKFKYLLEGMKEYRCFGEAQEILFLNENVEGGLRPFSILEGTGVEDISPKSPRAYVTIRANGNMYHEEAVGDGPINAFDIALKKALSVKYPEVNDIKLVPEGYRINLSNGDATTASEVEVCIKVEFKGKEIASLVRGTNQNRAGEAALADAYNACIIEFRKEREEQVLG